MNKATMPKNVAAHVAPSALLLSLIDEVAELPHRMLLCLIYNAIKPQKCKILY